MTLAVGRALLTGGVLGMDGGFVGSVNVLYVLDYFLYVPDFCKVSVLFG